MVNERTLEVYGYVVAADSFGGGYVIPLLEAFRNISTSLELLSIRLATTADMAAARLVSGRPAPSRLLYDFQQVERHDQENLSRESFEILGAQKSKPPTAKWQPDSGYSSMDKYAP